MRVRQTFQSYRQSGVDRDRAAAFLSGIRKKVRGTHGPAVVPYGDAFAGLFATHGGLLAASCDGVGSKLLIARALGRYREVGHDLVAVNVNDLLPSGATPLFFLDYLATARIDPAVLTPLIGGMVAACGESGCALLGGETAELPDLYHRGDFDLAGFAVGLTSAERLPRRESVAPGDRVLGLAASGLHANGFSLARRVLKRAKLDLKSTPTGFTRPLGEVLLTPTAIYVRTLIELGSSHPGMVKSAAHVSGGGLCGRAQMLVEASSFGPCRVEFDALALPKLPIFDLIASAGPVRADEMARTFNLGLGFLVVVAAADASRILSKSGSPWREVGRVVRA